MPFIEEISSSPPIVKIKLFIRLLDAVALGAFTVPGDGSLDFAAIVKRFADYGYEGWFVVEAEQDPRKNPPLKMAQMGHQELMRVMNAAGYTVETQGFPNG